MGIIDNFSEKKVFCLDCEIRVKEGEGMEFKDGYRCKDCSAEYKKKRGKLQ